MGFGGKNWDGMRRKTSAIGGARERQGILILQLSESKADVLYSGGFIPTRYASPLSKLNAAPVSEIIFKHHIKENPTHPTKITVCIRV